MNSGREFDPDGENALHAHSELVLHLGGASIGRAMHDPTERIDESAIISFPSDFAAIAAERGITKESVVTRLWNAAEDTIANMLLYHAQINGSRLPKHEVFSTHVGNTYDIDLHELLESFREVEAGEIAMGNSMGKLGWDIFAGLINERIAHDPNHMLVLPFDGTIHPYLKARSSDEASIQLSQTAVTALEQKYSSSQLF